jgi:hypothetical protein
VNLVQVHEIHLQPPQAFIQLVQNGRERPRPFGSSRITPCTLVATTTASRRVFFFRKRPTTSSLAPLEYTFAVSKKLIPRSSACFRNGWLCSSLSAHACRPAFGSPAAGGRPYVMHPRQMRETLSPVLPKFTYSTRRSLFCLLSAFF